MTYHRTWVRLNLKGMAHWGGVFVDGLVPVNRIPAQKIVYEALADPESVFSVDWKGLTEGQQQAISEKLSPEAGEEEFLAQIVQSGVSLPRTYVLWFGIGDKTFFPGGDFY